MRISGKSWHDRSSNKKYKPRFRRQILWISSYTALMAYFNAIIFECFTEKPSDMQVTIWHLKSSIGQSMVESISLLWVFQTESRSRDNYGKVIDGQWPSLSLPPPPPPPLQEPLHHPFYTPDSRLAYKSSNAASVSGKLLIKILGVQRYWHTKCIKS